MNVNVSPETKKDLEELAAQTGQDISDLAGALLDEHMRVRKLTISDALAPEDSTPEDPDALTRALAKFTNRTPEEIAQAQAQAIRSYKPERELPAGATLLDVVSGKWPGDESEDEIAQALRKLS